MAKRRCQWCDEPMPWWTKLVGFRVCKHCAYRMSMGGSPRRPKYRETGEKP